MLEIKYRHYIRINEQNEIIHAFSDAFEQPLETDILFQETEQRHCQLNILSEKYIGKYKYKWINGKVLEKTEEELFPLEELKARKIQLLNDKTQGLIIKDYPLWKQINLLSGMNLQDTPEEKQKMFNFINVLRNTAYSLETQIKACKTREDVEKIEI